MAAINDYQFLGRLLDRLAKDVDETRREVKDLGIQIEALRENDLYEIKQALKVFHGEGLTRDQMENIARLWPYETVNDVRRVQWLQKTEEERQREIEKANTKSQVELTDGRIKFAIEAKNVWAFARWLLLFGAGALAGHVPQWVERIAHVLQ